MRKLLAMGGILLVCGIAGVGCQNTAEGAKEDTAKNTAAVDQAADKAASAVDKAANNAANATKDAASDAGAALSVTPKVKDAITADAQLNNTANLIDVDSKDNVVHLKGHVMTNDMKEKATQIAEKALKDANVSNYTVSNELTVSQH